MLASPDALTAMDAAGLRALTQELLAALAAKDRELQRRAGELTTKQAHIDKLTLEIALLRRHRFGRRAEQLPAGVQPSLLEDDSDADLGEIESELGALAPAAVPAVSKTQPKRQALPAELARVEIRHDPHDANCTCGCQLTLVREEITEKLDYTPGTFTVERHIRPILACPKCERISQAPMPAYVIDKGIATPGLLAHVLVAKYADHLPVNRQEAIFGRAGVAIPRSTLAEWVGACGFALQPVVAALRAEILGCAVLHADETPVQLLTPGSKGVQRAYLWAYTPGKFGPLKAVVYDFAEGRSGAHAREFFGAWRGQLVCDDYTGYKACFALGVTEVGCWAHARRKFFDLHQATKSPVAAQALEHIAALYEIERQVRDSPGAERLAARETRAAPLADRYHAWLAAQRQRVPSGTATARAIDYTLRRWVALTRYLSDAALPMDNNAAERAIRPIALGRKNWLFAGSLRAGKRAAAVMSLIQSARMNGHDPYAYIKDVLTRLPTQLNRDIAELLPHRWLPG